MTERAATIKDVAAAAGVGIATVSRVFSGTGSVGAETRERVLAALDRMTDATDTIPLESDGEVVPDHVLELVHGDQEAEGRQRERDAEQPGY